MRHMVCQQKLSFFLIFQFSNFGLSIISLFQPRFIPSQNPSSATVLSTQNSNNGRPDATSDGCLVHVVGTTTGQRATAR